MQLRSTIGWFGDLKQVTDTKVIPYESVAAQHHLLVMDMKIVKPKLPRFRTGPKRFKWWKVKEHKEKLTTMLLSLAVNTDQPVEKMWTEVGERIHNIAQDTVGSTKPGRKYIEKQVWWLNGWPYSWPIRLGDCECMKTSPDEIGSKKGSGLREKTTLPRSL